MVATGGAPPVGFRPRLGGWAGAFASVLGFAVVMALWGITISGRTLRAPPFALSVAIVLLPWLYAAACAALFALWAVVPDRRAPPVALAATALSAVFLWGPRPVSDVPVAGATDIRVVAWNVRRLWGGPGAIGRPAEIAAATTCVTTAVTALNPDVAVLLEVTAADVDRLSAALSLDCVHSDYEGEGDRNQGGLAVCARGAARLRSGDPRRFVDDEPWTYVFAEVEKAGRVFNVLGVHLYPYGFEAAGLGGRLRAGDPGALVDLNRRGESIAKGQADQSAALVATASRLHDPTIVAGDFNSTRDGWLHVALRQRMVDAWEQAGQGPGATVRFLGLLPLRVDYVYAGDGVQVRSTKVPPETCSDHHAVVTDLAIGG